MTRKVTKNLSGYVGLQQSPHAYSCPRKYGGTLPRNLTVARSFAHKGECYVAVGGRYFRLCHIRPKVRAVCDDTQRTRAIFAYMFGVGRKIWNQLMPTALQTDSTVSPFKYSIIFAGAYICISKLLSIDCSKRG